MVETVADTNETRTTSSTGGEKGVKEARFDLIPWRFIWELATLYGWGAKYKYADENWRKGYEWKKSYGAIQRHLNLFWLGHMYDTGPGGSGKHHLVAAAWHCIALYTFSMNRKKYGKFDDRPDLEEPEIEYEDTPGTVSPDLDASLEDFSRVSPEIIKGHAVLYQPEKNGGYIDGAFFRGTDFTSQVERFKRGFETVDEEVEYRSRSELQQTCRGRNSPHA
jgi:hypothetical protein